MLAEKFNPKIIRVLAATADSLGEVNVLVEGQAERVFRRCRRTGSAELLFDIDCLLENHPVLVKETIRLGIREIKGDLKDIHRRHIEGIMALACAQSGGQLHLPGGIRVRREFDNLIIGRPIETPRFSYPLEAPGGVEVAEVGKRLQLRRLGEAESGSRRDLLRNPGVGLEVRNRLPGDRFQIKAGLPEKKLKEILIERKVPRSSRDRLLILAQGPNVLWVEGLGVSPAYRADGPGEETFEITVEGETFSG